MKALARASASLDHDSDGSEYSHFTQGRMMLAMSNGSCTKWT